MEIHESVRSLVCKKIKAGGSFCSNIKAYLLICITYTCWLRWTICLYIFLLQISSKPLLISFFFNTTFLYFCFMEFICDHPFASHLTATNPSPSSSSASSSSGGLMPQFAEQIIYITLTVIFAIGLCCD